MVLTGQHKTFIMIAGVEKGSARTLRGFTIVLRFLNNEVSQGYIRLSFYVGPLLGNNNTSIHGVVP